MTPVLQTLAIAAAVGTVLLVLVVQWRSSWADVIALTLSGFVVSSAALQVDEIQIALAWLSARVVAIALLATARPFVVVAGAPPSSSPRLLFARTADVTPSGRLSERVFRVAVTAVWLGIAAVLALRAHEAGLVPDLIQAWAALALLGGGIVASVLSPEPIKRSVALLLALSGLAIGLVWLDRDWGRALAVGVMELIIAVQAVAEPGEEAVR